VLTIAHDLRYALRGLRRSPGVAAVILLTLAIGIGVNTAIFSFVDAILLKPLPYPNADRIVGIWERRPSGQPNSMTTLNYLDYARQNSVFERIAATTGCCGLTILNGEPAVTLFALHVSPQYFDVFGASAALGRTFAAGDDEPGRDHVIVLSHRAWASRFGSDPALVGKAVRINGEPHTVIGVMPEHGPFDRMIVEAWLPLTFTPDRMNRTSHWLLWLTGGAIARLKPGVRPVGLEPPVRPTPRACSRSAPNSCGRRLPRSSTIMCWSRSPARRSRRPGIRTRPIISSMASKR